jgi:pyruvyl transferase EpsO
MLEKVYLAPDAVHHLGRIFAPQPTQKILLLARRDQESSMNSQDEGSVDWKRDDFELRWTSSLRWKSKYLGPFQSALNLPVSRWQRAAERRLSRGVNILSVGETIVTDRLHAMLIALQMGRRVIAVDNNNNKLTKYADTWFKDTNPDIKFTRDFSSAVKLA